MESVQARLVRIRNELKAQKVASGLAFSSLLMPENNPTATWSGSISFASTGADNILARIRFRFARTAGSDAPMVNFTIATELSPKYASYIATQGLTVTGDDVDYVDEQSITSYVADSGDGWVDYYVDFDTTLLNNFYTLTAINATVTVTAVAMVAGTLTTERII